MMKKVWINGTFDVLHLGHLHLIKEASKLGEVKAGIDSDKRVKLLKGSTRPINTEQDRKEFLLSIKGVDSVEIFNTDQELSDLIKSYGPDYFVIGNDYENKKIIGIEHAKEIVFIPRIKNYSSTGVISKIRYDEKNPSSR